MNRVLVTLLAISIFTAPAAFGAVTDEDLEQLRQQLFAMSERLDELAAENAELKRSRDASAAADVQTNVTQVRNPGADAAAESWPDRIRLDGDFRYRYEGINEEGSQNLRRNRIRARANIRADLADDVEIGFGLATGGNDPVSTNQTLGEGGSSKNIALNLAYVDWAPLDGLHLLAGKYKNVLYRPGKQALMWDGDWTPEGLALSYKREWFFANAIGNWLESDSSKGNDSFSWGGQVGAKGEVGGTTLTGGLAYYSINTKGKSTTFGDASDPDDYYGNTSVEPGGVPCGSTPGTDCAYLYDYLLTEIFGEAAFDVGSWPTTVFVDYVHNSDATENNSGWTVGTRMGSANDRGKMRFSYVYTDKPADSTFGLVTDSDFAGGGTDNRGHFFQFNIGINKTWAIGAQYFINEIDVSTGNKRDYNRLMIDTWWNWK